MAPRVRFVTSNAHKFEEVRSILSPFGVALRRVARELPELQSDTLETVVRGKLAALRGGAGWSLVEDSGLFLDSLGGFPGVYSAFVYKSIGLEGILRLLEGKGRDAKFRTVAGLRRGGKSWLKVGEVHGRVSTERRGRGGFGFDPIFIPEGHWLTYAEMSPEQKNALSHRGKAFRAVGRALSSARAPRGSA